MAIDPQTDTGSARAVRPKSFLRQSIRRIGVFVGMFLVAWWTTLYFYQDKLLFARDLAPDPLPRLYDVSTELLSIDTPEGKSVAFFIPAPKHGATVKRSPAVVFFHGNAEIIDFQDDIVEGYRVLGCSVLLPEFRGYGRSDGTPSEEAIVADADAFYKMLIERTDVDPERIVFHGRSLGGGPAAQLAALHTPRVLILQSTFKSVAAMASKYGAPSFLARNPFRTDLVLEMLDIPVMILHGTHDDIIPVEHGRALRRLARRPTYVEYDCRHNDFPGNGNDEDYWNKIAAFLTQNGVLKK